MEYQELIERLRGFEIDHPPDGWPAIRMREISAMCDAIESLLAENERLNHNLTSTEQTMREYQELAAKRLEEIDRLKDERESHGPEGRNYTNLQVVEMRQKFTERINEQKAELAKYRDAPVVAYQHRDGMLSFRLPGGGVLGIDWASLIVKPGEDK